MPGDMSSGMVTVCVLSMNESSFITLSNVLLMCSRSIFTIFKKQFILISNNVSSTSGDFRKSRNSVLKIAYFSIFVSIALTNQFRHFYIFRVKKKINKISIKNILWDNVKFVIV